jgi:hypothetical protein
METSHESDKHPGCPSISRKDELITEVHDLVQNYRTLTIGEMTEKYEFLMALIRPF